MNNQIKVESFRRLEAKINEKFNGNTNRKLQMLQIAAISTGICDLEYGCNDICPLHCVTGMPMYDDECIWYQAEQYLEAF